MFTATEAAAVAAAYALLIDILVFRRLTWHDIRASLLEAALVSSVLLMIIASAKLLGIMLTIERVPDAVATAILSLTDNRYLVLLLINVFLLFMGMIMETGAIVIILAPILLPVAVKVGIDPLHFALVMLVNVNIGLATPPLGVCLFAAAPIAQCPYERIALVALPFIFAEIAVLFLITYVPTVVLFLPILAGVH
jgi:tripartite ATP-independent transporter DctM subunit